MSKNIGSMAALEFEVVILVGFLRLLTFEQIRDDANIQNSRALQRAKKNPTPVENPFLFFQLTNVENL